MQNKKIINILKGSIIWTAIFLFVGGFGSWLLFQKIKSEEANLEETKNNYETTLKQIQVFDTVKKDFENTKKLKSQVEKIIVKPENTLELIQELEKDAQTSGVTLNTSVGERPGSKKNIPKVGQPKLNNSSEQEIWLLLEVNGSFKKILQFVKRLETGDKLVSVSDVDIGQSQNISPEDIFETGSESLGNLKATILVTNVF